MWLMQSALRFAAVGAIGFVADAGVLSLLVSATGLGPYLPRLVSFPFALSVTWWLNRVWSFGDLGGSAAAQYGRYATVQMLGALLNLAVYAVSIAAGPAWFTRFPMAPLGIASLVAMGFNFLGARWWVFDGARS